MPTKTDVHISTVFEWLAWCAITYFHCTYSSECENAIGVCSNTLPLYELPLFDQDGDVVFQFQLKSYSQDFIASHGEFSNGP